MTLNFGYDAHAMGSFSRLLFAAVVATASSHLSAAQSPNLNIVPHVDQRVELLSIIFRLAGNPEYNTSPLKSYTNDIDVYFSRFKNDKAVVMARELASRKGVSYDAVMAMAIHLSPAPALTPLVPFTDTVPEPRWGKQNALRFVQLLHQFYRKTHFEKFFTTHASLYRAAESRYAAILGNLNLNWYKNFYGELPKGHFNLVLGINNGNGNYGPKVVLPDGQEELFAIVGAGEPDSSGLPTYTRASLPTLIHEFNHSFINPLVDQYSQELAVASQYYEVVASKMEAMAYGTPQIMVKESLVRAAVILYLESSGEIKRRILRSMRQEQARGFIWMDDLCDLLRQYEAQRSRYPTFNAFMPEIVKFFQTRALGIKEKIARFNADCVHFAGMQPFAENSQNADPATTELIVSFDKPLDPANGYSINYGLEGGEHWPIAGKPEFLDGGRSLKLPVKLKPDWNYSFVLTPLSFASADGYPLETYTVNFKTR